MSNEKFTGGKWSKHLDGTIRNVDCTVTVAKFNICGAFISDEEKANANLIAAAPDMYRMLDRLSEYRSFQGVPAWTDEINKILEKARGES